MMGPIAEIFSKIRKFLGVRERIRALKHMKQGKRRLFRNLFKGWKSLGIFCPGSLVVEHLLGKQEVASSILAWG